LISRRISTPGQAASLVTHVAHHFQLRLDRVREGARQLAGRTAKSDMDSLTAKTLVTLGEFKAAVVWAYSHYQMLVNKTNSSIEALTHASCSNWIAAIKQSHPLCLQSHYIVCKLVAALSVVCKHHDDHVRAACNVECIFWVPTVTFLGFVRVRYVAHTRNI